MLLNTEADRTLSHSFLPVSLNMAQLAHKFDTRCMQDSHVVTGRFPLESLVLSHTETIFMCNISTTFVTSVIQRA